ncbi:MAG: hypothetical protein WD049_09660 [Candidatus Paceibacterota bacterium]
MRSEGANERWQFGLRSFLFAALIVGAIAGVVMPILLEAITEWSPPSPTPKQRTRPAAPSAESANYFESAETPLH